MVLTYRTGAGDQLAQYYHESAATAELAEQLASYLGPAYALRAAADTAALPILDMHPLIADLLKIDVTRSLAREEVANLLAGKCTDGSDIPGRQVHKSTKERAALTFTDFTFSAPKSLSVAIELGDEKERIALETAFMRANNALMKHIEREIGGARMGRSGRHGVVPGHMAVVQFHHYTARPTKRIADGADTKLARDQSPLRPGDMQRHIHNLFVHVTVTDQGDIRAPDLQTMQGRIHEWGAIGHAFLAKELRAAGVCAAIDPRTGLSYLPDVPQPLVDLFSARTRQAEVVARAQAAGDFDSLSAAEKRRRVKTAAKTGREHKEGQTAKEFWRQTAADVGYTHQPVIHPENRQDLAAAEVRRDTAYEAALPMLEKELERRSTLDWSTIRTMAARGMIAAGTDRADDVEDVVTALFDRGVRQDGQMVALLPGREHGQRFMSATTSLHVEQEREAIGILKAAAADSTGALTRDQIEAAIARVASQKGYDFTSPHGQNQRAMAVALATRGRAAAGIGAAGAGKGVVLEPVIDAHHAAGWSSYGVTVAWRQTHGLKAAGVGRKGRADTRLLVSAGIDPDRAMALAPFLAGIEAGRIKPDHKTLVVLDEVGTVTTQQVRDLARAQAKHGFKVVMTGDDQQCASIGAGNTIQLLRHALGADQIPELLETVRQKRAEDRVTSKLLRDGEATEAMQRKDAAGLLALVPGDYDDAIKAGVDWLIKRQAANAGRPGYSVGVSVPSNADVFAFGTAYRARQRAGGKLPGEDWLIEAQDQRGETYDLRVAIGDQVRLFNRVNASLAGGKHGNFGDNGTVAEVVGIDQQYGLRLKRVDGTVGAVRWRSLQDRNTGRIRLAYGSATTIDARQSETLSDHATLLPNGSQAIDGKKAYSADTRGKYDNVIITSHGAEKEAVRNRRPLGDPWLSKASDDEIRTAVIENIGRNLSRQPEKLLGVDFLDQAITANIGGVSAEQSDWFKARPAQQAAPAATVQTVRDAIAHSPIKLLTGPDQVRRERRMMRPAAERPKRTANRRLQMSPAEVQAEFARALDGIGLKLDGPPIMDGEKHTVRVDGNRGARKSGFYRGFADGRRVSVGHNSQRGETVRWKPGVDSTGTLTPAERDAQRLADRQARLQEQANRKALEEETAVIAAAIWNAAKPASPLHPYLVKKQIPPGELRQGAAGQVMPLGDSKQINIAGRLIVPLRDEDGRIWNVQVIGRDGSKLFMSGRKKGLSFTIGQIDPAKPIMIGEGVATLATLHNSTALTSVAAIDSGNLYAVAASLRTRYPETALIFAADNDHHLPRRTPPLPNVGLVKARDAADAVGGVVVAPQFHPADKSTDWNDMRATQGEAATRRAIEQAFHAVGIAELMPPATSTTTQSGSGTMSDRVEQKRERQAATQTAHISEAQREAARRASRQVAQTQDNHAAARDAARAAARQNESLKP